MKIRYERLTALGLGTASPRKGEVRRLALEAQAARVIVVAADAVLDTYEADIKARIAAGTLNKGAVEDILAGLLRRATERYKEVRYGRLPRHSV